MHTDFRHCSGCNNPLPPPFLDLGNLPFANSYIQPEEIDKPEATCRLAVSFCPSCYLVQLTDVVPPDFLFSEYLYFSSYSTSVVDHAREMAADLTDRFRLGAASKVLEIASNDGYLLQHFTERGIPVLGVEPATNIARVAKERGIPTLNAFFGPDLVEEVLTSFGPVDVIMGNNVLAHVPTINDFLAAVRACLAPGGHAVFEFPYLADLLSHCEFDTIYHEHVFYFSLSAIRILAGRAGMTLVDVSRQSIHGGSLRVTLSKTAGEPSNAVTEMLKTESEAALDRPEAYEEFSREVSRVKTEFLDLLHSLKREGKRIAAYGAPAKGNTLLCYCGIGTDLIDFTVDRNPYKQNHLLPGSRIPIYAPEELTRAKPDYAVILPWNIADEVQNQQHAFIAAGGKFITPIPAPRILPTEPVAMPGAAAVVQ